MFWAKFYCLYSVFRLLWKIFRVFWGELRFRQVKPEEWREERIRWKDVRKKYGRFEGAVMFPSSHDITPKNLLPYLIVLRKLLRAGNKVLVVSKPHLECIRVICRAFEDYRSQILFRFTIGARDNELLSFWEPGAPSFEERKRSLSHAFAKGFQTSVSAEPMLDPDHVDDLVADLLPLVTDAMWIGKMNHSRNIKIEGEFGETMLGRIMEGQSDMNIKAIYARLKSTPKIKWKSHIKKVVGIPLADKPGMDI